MRHDDIAPAEVAQRYAAAHTVHYSAGNLRQAIELYRAILVEHPEAREAEYSRSQIESIVRTVVPAGVLLQAGVDLACAQLDRANPTDL